MIPLTTLQMKLLCSFSNNGHEFNGHDFGKKNLHLIFVKTKIAGGRKSYDGNYLVC